MLAARNITKRFSGVTALSGITWNCILVKVNAIIGENGAG
jgi:ribose transport system ATP-binding protein